MNRTTSLPEPDYRFTLANERTFLAWQRTALGLLAAAVAVIQFLPDTTGPAVRFGLGTVLGVLATVTSVGGLHRWRSNDHAIRRGLPLPRPRATTGVAAVLAIAGLATVAAALVSTTW